MARKTSRGTNAGTQPLLDLVTETLVRSGCELLHVSGSSDGTFRLSYEGPLLQRVGLSGQLVALHPHPRDPEGATATIRLPEALNGSSPCDPDPFGLFTAVLLAVDPTRDLLVALDPGRHFPEDEPLHISISGEPIRTALSRRWYAWLREEYENEEDPGFAETVVGFTRSELVRYVLFERLATGLDTGPRERLSEMFFDEVIRHGGSGKGLRRFPL